MHEHESAAAEIAGSRQGDREREAHRHRSVDRVAAPAQDLHPDLGGQRLLCRHHTVGREHRVKDVLPRNDGAGLLGRDRHPDREQREHHRAADEGSRETTHEFLPETTAERFHVLWGSAPAGDRPGPFASMTAKTIKPYGEWRSPITTEVLVADSVRLDSVALDGEDVYWLEGRPADGGRYVLVRRAPDGELTDVTPAPFNVRTRVHEYGGGSYLVAGRRVWFSNFSDQRLYYHPLGRRAGAAHPAGSVPVRGPAPRRAPRAHHLRARDACRRRSRSAQRAGRGQPRKRRIAGARERPRLLLGHCAQPGRRRARVDHLGSPEHALGRQRSVASRLRRARRTRTGAEDRRRGRGCRSISRAGRIGESCSWYPTPVVGGICTDGVAVCCRPSSSRARISAGLSGSSAPPPTGSSRISTSCVRAAMPGGGSCCD